jgi:AcrR family transcriptional regulator
MGVADRVADRSVAEARARAAGEVAALVDAGLAVLARAGAGLTVADVLSEAGLSTRAFYRHFRSKDELVLAIYARDAEASRERLDTRLAAAAGTREAFETWVDETLALAFDRRRARRTAPLAAEGARLRHEFPEEFAAILEGVLQPLVGVLERGRNDGTFSRARPEIDARSIHALVWALAEARLAGDAIDRVTAREQALRFCLPALGAQA